jgi:hypothetical protein
MKFRSSLVLAGIVIAMLGGCRSSGIYNVSAAPVVANKTVSMDDVQKAIVRAGKALGWEMSPVEPGVILGTLRLRTHMAMVNIKYDTKTYSITYKDSSNLNYTGDSIHKNYNGWILNLDSGIRTQLTNL